MKTLLTACLVSLSFALISLAQSPAPPQTSQPGAPPVARPGAPAAASPGAPAAVNPGAPAAASPGAPAAVNPAAPAQLPTGTAPAGGPAAPAASIAATLSPAPTATETPATGGLLASNWLVDKFHKGGPIMWPILIVSIIGLTVVIERIFWWTGRWFRRDPKRIEKVFTAIENGDTAEASRLSRGSRDPVLRMMWNGLNHQHASLQGALQVAAGIEIKRAGRFLVVMDTLVTLAP